MGLPVDAATIGNHGTKGRKDSFAPDSPQRLGIALNAFVEKVAPRDAH
jgi:hypothetical protein